MSDYLDRLERELLAAGRAYRQRSATRSSPRWLVWLRMMGRGLPIVVSLAVSLAVVAVVLTLGAKHSGSTRTSAAPAKVSPVAQAALIRVNRLLAGIPESGMTLGSPGAKVTVTVYGDLECHVCGAFALPSTVNTLAGQPGSGLEIRLINQYVRTGKVKLVYRSLETASSASPIADVFLPQQAAAYAAGLQHKAWYYIELFLNEQGKEGTGYVTPSYLKALATQIPGLNYASWLANRQSPTLEALVARDEQHAQAAGYHATPTLTVEGPRGKASPITQPTSFSQIVDAINSVS